MCNLDKVVGLRGYQYSCCHQKFQQVLAAPCVCLKDLKGKSKKMLLRVDKTVQIFRSQKKEGTPMLQGPPLSGLENNGDIEKVQTPSEVPEMPEFQEPTEKDPLPLPNTVSSTRPSISSETMTGNRGKEPIVVCGLFPTKSPMSQDATEASLQMEASTASKPPNVARCGCGQSLIPWDSVAREKMEIKRASEPDEKTSGPKSPAASRRSSQSNISNRSKSPAASRRSSQTSKISKRTKSPSNSRRSSQSKMSKRSESPANSRRNSRSNMSNRSKSPASIGRTSQTTEIRKPTKSPSDSRRSSQTSKIRKRTKSPSNSRRSSQSKMSKRSESPANSRRNSRSNMTNRSKSPASIGRTSQTTEISKPTKSPADSKISPQTKSNKRSKSPPESQRYSSNICNCRKIPASLRRNSKTTKSPADSKKSSQTKISKRGKSPADSRRNSSNISNHSKSPAGSKRSSQTSKISNPTKSPADASRNSPAKNTKSPADSSRNSQTKITESPPSKTFSLTELTRAIKSPPPSRTNSLKENNSQLTSLNKEISPRVKSVAVPAQSSLTQKINQSVLAQESLMNGSKNKSKPINFNEKQNGKVKEPFKSCTCRVVPEKTLVSETNLSCKCCDSTKILYSNKGKPNNTQNPRQTPKIKSKPIAKQVPKPMPKSNKNQKPPVEEKALVKASPKRKKFTPAKASGKAKVLPGGLTGSPKVSSDDDGIWFECNLPFRVNIPFPVCMQKFFGFPGISLSNTDPKNGNLKAIMPATNGDLPSGFQSETPGGCNKNTCPKRKLGRRGNKICPCETATQTGEEENDPLLACLEQIKDKLQNLSPQVQAVQAKPCVCFLAEKGTNVREKTIKRSSLSLDSPEDGKRSKERNSRDSSLTEDPNGRFVRNSSESRASEAGLPNTEPKSKRRFSNGGHCNASPMPPTYMRQPHVFPTHMHYHPFPRWNYPMYHPQCVRPTQPPSFLPNWQGQPLGNCISYRSLINGEQEKTNCINHMAYPKNPRDNPYMEPIGNFIPSSNDQNPGSDRSFSGHSVDLWQPDRSLIESNFVEKTPVESTYRKGLSQFHTSPGNNLSNVKISQRSIMKRPSNLGVQLSSTQKKTSSKCISFKMNDSDEVSHSNRSSRTKHSKNSKSKVLRREKSNTDHSDMSETSSSKMYHRNSDSLASLRGSREMKNCESYIRETKPFDNMSLEVHDLDEFPIKKANRNRNNDSNVNDSERNHQRAESGMEKLERTAKQYSKFKETMPIITEICIPKIRSLSVPVTRRFDSQNLFLRQHNNEERSPRFFKQLRRGGKGPGRSTKMYILKDPLTTTITKYELDSSQSKVCGTPDDNSKQKALFIPREINETKNNSISNHGKPNPPMVFVPFRVETSKLINAQPDRWNKVQLTLAVARPPKKHRLSHRRPFLRNTLRYTPHRSASGQEFPQDNKNSNRKATNLGFRPCENYCPNSTRMQSCQRGCKAPTVKPSFGNTSQAEPSSSRNHIRPTNQSSYNNSPQCQPTCSFKSVDRLKISCQKQDCQNSLTYLKGKSKSSTSQWSSSIPPAALKYEVPRSGPQRSGPSTPPAKQNKMQTKKTSGNSIIQPKTNNSIGKKKPIPNKKPPYNMANALSREVVEQSSPMYCDCTPPDQRSIDSINSEDRPKTSDRAIQKDHFQNGKRSSYEENSLTSCGSSRSQYSTTSNQSRNREELQAKYSKVQSSNSSVGYTNAYSDTSFESRKGNCYCSPVASKVSSLYQKSRDPDWKEAVLEEAHPSYTRINKPSTESDVSVSAKDYREGDDPVSVSGTKTVTKESSRISKKPPQVTKTPSYESKSEEECLCDPNYQSPDEEVQKPTGRSQRRRVNEDSYNSGSRDNRVYNSSSGYSQSGNSSQVKGSHPSRIIASCLPNCTDSCSFKKRTHQAKNNSRTNNKKAPETVTLMQPRRFRSTESTQRGKDAIESGEDMDTKNTVLIETRIPCDRKNLMQTCGRPPCNFHRLQYSGVPPVVEQRNMYMRPPPPQTVPQRSHPNDEDYLIDPRDHLPPLASAPVMGNPYPMPMINAFHRTSSSYPYTNLHQASCRDPYSCPAILKNNIRSMPKGFYEETLQKYNITRMDSDFQPPTLRSDILYQQLNGAPDRQFSNHLNRPMMMKSSGYNQHHMPPPNPFQAQPSHSMFGPHQNVKLEGYDFSEYQI
ncbi:serine/arginine repetitive matrix protein 2 [Drosophila bipectinata]|uniref:serine/arginine repetitive matrix protein 2 n=1 Tax=Drosophila bipectinata TaxID=42026 RepID=UPI0038B33053